MCVLNNIEDFYGITQSNQEVTMKILAGILTVFLLFSNIGVDTLFADTVERTFPAAGIVEVKADGASIELIGNGDNQIELEVESNKDIEKHYRISSELDDGVLRIFVKRKKDAFKLLGFSRSPSISLSLTVPFKTACTLMTSGGSIEACSLDADLSAITSGGSITCNDVKGEVTVKTSGGSLNCRAIAGRLEAITSGGSIRLEKVTGAFNGRTSGGAITAEELTGDGLLHTSGGTIKLSKCNGAIELKTSGGRITVKEHSGSLKANTSAGSVSASFVSPPDGDCVLKTSAGSIKLALPKDSGAELNANASAGKVSCELAIHGTIDTDRHSLRCTIGQGGPNLTLKTSAGSIRITAVN